VVGYPSKIFGNEKLALYIHEEHHLIPWQGSDQKRMMDRYDVRNLLDNEKHFVEQKRKSDADARPEDEIALDVERYRDLFAPPQEEEEDPKINEDDQEERKADPPGSYNNVGFQYEEDLQKKIDNKEEPYTPPFPVPPNITIPSETQHSIILKTAKFAAVQGTKGELILKLKQSNNSKFDFMSNNNALHPYYQFIKKKLPLIEALMELQVTESSDSKAVATSSSSSTSETKQTLNTKESKGEKDEEQKQKKSEKEDEKMQKARRLKKAKLVMQILGNE